jgi:hypothetical protein
MNLNALVVDALYVVFLLLLLPKNDEFRLKKLYIYH